MKEAISRAMSLIEHQARERLRARLHRSFRVLVADDSPDDHFLLRRALQGTLFLQHVGAVYNGIEVQQYLLGKDTFGDRERFPFPDLLLLDLDMPGRGGLEVLSWLPAQGYARLRVVILSSLLDFQRAEKAIELGADHIQSKPAGQDEWARLMHMLEVLMVVTMHGEDQSKSLCGEFGATCHGAVGC